MPSKATESQPCTRRCQKLAAFFYVLPPFAYVQGACVPGGFLMPLLLLLQVVTPSTSSYFNTPLVGPKVSISTPLGRVPGLGF